MPNQRSHNLSDLPHTDGQVEVIPAQRWVDGTRILSPRLITDLLRWSGDRLDAYLGTIDLTASSSVY